MATPDSPPHGSTPSPDPVTCVSTSIPVPVAWEAKSAPEAEMNSSTVPDTTKLTTLLLHQLKKSHQLPHLDYIVDLSKTFTTNNKAWFELGILGVVIIGKHITPTLIMSLGACDSTHYEAVLHHVG